MRAAEATRLRDRMAADPGLVFEAVAEEERLLPLKQLL